MTLREARTALGWTQQKLEAESGVKQQTISEMENGSFGRVQYESVVKLVRCFQRSGLPGLTAEQLFPISEERIS